MLYYHDRWKNPLNLSQLKLTIFNVILLTTVNHYKLLIKLPNVENVLDWIIIIFIYLFNETSYLSAIQFAKKYLKIKIRTSLKLWGEDFKSLDRWVKYISTSIYKMVD